jgi:RHS repeat-associated protein
VEKYLWQGMTRLLAIYNGANTLVMRFEYADERMPVAMTAGGLRYNLIYDHVGSLRSVADNSGNVVKSIQYDSFGNILEETNPAFYVPIGFAGGLHDRDTGLVRFGYRDYDPDVGRWTAKDPIGFAGGDTDLYGYVLNDPVNSFDPEGKLAFYWHFGITFVAAFNSGSSFSDSYSLAKSVMAEDRNALSHNPNDTVIHAMGGDLGSRYQTPVEAIAAATDFINDNSNPLSARIHSTQDLPVHAGESMRMFGFNWATSKHILADVFGGGTIGQAYKNTRNVLNGGCGK